MSNDTWQEWKAEMDDAIERDMRGEELREMAMATDDAFRAWWKGYAPGEGLTAKDTAARSFAKVVWAAGYAAGARHENSEHLRRLSESLERALVERRAEASRSSGHWWQRWIRRSDG